MSRIRVGVLALQGDFREHIAMVRAIGADAFEVRTAEELAAVDALIIPGGESTAIGRLARIYDMVEPLRRHIEAGLPVLGTCAGMIFLGSATTGREQTQLGLLDVVVERNAFGRQVDSFESDFDIPGFEEPMHAVFIRAPWIHKSGEAVEVLAAVEDPVTGEERPVFVRQGNILATSFHPELTEDTRVHEALLAMVEER
jgi:5'-phosphate synthase pdxT subunit